MRMPSSEGAPYQWRRKPGASVRIHGLRWVLVVSAFTDKHNKLRIRTGISLGTEEVYSCEGLISLDRVFKVRYTDTLQDADFAK